MAKIKVSELSKLIQTAYRNGYRDGQSGKQDRMEAVMISENRNMIRTNHDMIRSMDASDLAAFLGENQFLVPNVPLVKCQECEEGSCIGCTKKWLGMEVGAEWK